MDGDSNMDIVVGNFKGSGVVIFPGNGTVNGFAASTPIGLSGGTIISGIDIADLNGDGNPDIVAANADSATPSLELFYPESDIDFY